jgi:integrase
VTSLGRLRPLADSTPSSPRTTSEITFAHGATLKEIQRMLGHAKASITLDRYTAVLESMQSRTDDRLDAAFRSPEAASPREAPLAVGGWS